MPLVQPVFRVYLNPMDDGDPAEHVVTITHQDQLRAELELNRNNISTRAALNMTNAWCWAAMVRSGNYVGPWDRFKDFDCAGVESEDDDGVAVDPTQQGTPDGSP